MWENFKEWRERHREEVTHIRALLDIPLSDEPEALWQNVRDIEAHYGRLQYLVAIADEYLDEAECQALETLQRQYEKLAAYEKEKMVNASVSEIRGYRDLLAGLIEAVKQRIMLGQSRMLRDLSLKGDI